MLNAFSPDGSEGGCDGEARSDSCPGMNAGVEDLDFFDKPGSTFFSQSGISAGGVGIDSTGEIFSGRTVSTVFIFPVFASLVGSGGGKDDSNSSSQSGMGVLIREARRLGVGFGLLAWLYSTNLDPGSPLFSMNSLEAHSWRRPFPDVRSIP